MAVKYLEDGTIDLQALYNKEFKMKEITQDVLFTDAVARNSEEAIDFIEEEAKKEKEVTYNKGKENERKGTKLQSLGEYRAAYLTKFAGYETKTKKDYAAKAKANREAGKKAISDKAAAARAKLKK